MTITPIRDIPMPQRCVAIRTWKLTGQDLRAWIDRCRCDLERYADEDTPEVRAHTEAILEALQASEACRVRFGQKAGTKVEEALLGGLRTLLRFVVDDDPIVSRVLSLPPVATGDVVVDRARAAFQASADYVAALRGLGVPVG